MAFKHNIKRNGNTVLLVLILLVVTLLWNEQSNTRQTLNQTLAKLNVQMSETSSVFISEIKRNTRQIERKVSNHEIERNTPQTERKVSNQGSQEENNANLENKMENYGGNEQNAGNPENQLINGDNVEHQLSNGNDESGGRRRETIVTVYEDLGPENGTFEKYVYTPGIIMFRHLPIDISKTTNPRKQEAIFVKAADRVDLHCKRWRRAGDSFDGGWNVCLSNNYSLESRCLVYSFGIKNDWSFDEYVAKRYKCRVRAFDPSIKKKNHTHGDKYPVKFYSLGLSGSNYRNDQHWSMRSFSYIYNYLERGHKPVVSYLKIDIEASEYEAIVAMEKDNVLQYIKQIGFELHFSALGIEKSVRILHILERNWFRKWAAHVNMGAYRQSHLNRHLYFGTCYEFYYVNTRYLDVNNTQYVNIVAPYGYNAFN